MASLMNDGDRTRLERSCGPGKSDWIRVAPSAQGFERMEAAFAGHAFDPHRHDTYAIGITTSGVQSFRYRGAERHSVRGHVIVLHPDELHDGHAGSDDGFVYRMAYIEPRLIRDALGSSRAALPFVGQPVNHTRRLVKAVMAALSDMDSPLEELEVDHLIAGLTDALCAASGSQPPAAAIDQTALVKARELLDASVETGMSSDQLEHQCGVGRYTLARQFRHAFGTSPHRYLTMRRLDRARALIGQGMPLSEAAMAGGFSDQSHMTRHFKSAYGVTPGMWSRLRRSGL